MRKSRKSQRVIQFIIDNIETHPKDIVTFTANQFEITRVTANRYIQQLITEQVITAKGGKTSSKEYSLNSYINKEYKFITMKDNEEHKIWKDYLAKYFSDIDKNVEGICYYGVTEMINNVIDHSASRNFTVRFERNAKRLIIQIKDNGIGIFEKIRSAKKLDDTRHALLELSKGKLTTDPKNHTGQGVFFTSRMFDYFSILSDELLYSRFLQEDDDWLIEVKDNQKIAGTSIILEINTNTKRTAKEIFDKYTDDDYNFSKTHVPVSLVKYGSEELVSRSQAKRVLARFDKFSEIMLDFQDVKQIGQAFADQIFRVFKNEHPDIKIITLNTTPEIKRMIKAAEKNAADI